MWLERFGQVDERVFVAFCFFVALVSLLTLANVVAAFFSGAAPGQSVTFLLNLSVLCICASVLFRGVQPSWTSVFALRLLCQFFTVQLVVGCTLFTAVLCVQSWAFAVVFVLKRRSQPWVHLVVVCSLLLLACVPLIVWELVFTSDVLDNSQLTASNPYNQSVLECGDSAQLWVRPNSTSRSSYQADWRIALSAYFAAIVGASLFALPMLFSLQLPQRLVWLRPKHIALIIVNVNLLASTAAGLGVWFAFSPPLGGSGEGAAPPRDTYQYAIIGGLQLWVLLFTQGALLVGHLLTVHKLSCGCCCGEKTIRWFGSARRLIPGDLQTFDIDTIDLSVQTLDLYSPRPDGSRGGVRYANDRVPATAPPLDETFSNTSRFRY